MFYELLVQGFGKLRNIRPPAATIRSCASSLKWLAPLRPLPKMTNQKKTDYICISKESEGPAPDTLDETLPLGLYILKSKCQRWEYRKNNK